jgi:hypothetical protein
MNEQQPTQKVDHAALRVNQAFIIGLLVLAFVLDSLPLVLLVGVVMLIGTAVPQWGLFKAVYLLALKPLKLVRPDVIVDNPEPHRFAQGFGGVVVMAAAAAFLAHLATVGWALVWLVIILAALNLFLGFCAGCFLYYQLHRLGVPGFTARPIGR